MNYERTISKFRIKTAITLLFSFLMFSSQVFAQTNGRQSNTGGFMFNENFWLIVITVIASILIAKYFHQSGVITIYENYTDLAYTIGAPLIVWTVSSLLDKTVGNQYAINISFVYLALHILWIFYASFRANNSDIKSAVVAILKIFLSMLSLLVAFFSFWAIFGSDNKKNETAVEYRKRMVGIALASTISAWVLSYIGKGLCREKKFVTPSEYFMMKKPASLKSGTPYLTITSALSLLALMGYLQFAPLTSKHTEPETAIQAQVLTNNSTTNVSQVGQEVTTPTDYETALTQFAEKFDALQPTEREQLVQQMKKFLPFTFSDNGLNMRVDSISINNNILTFNQTATNASNSQMRIQDEKTLFQVNVAQCVEWYFSGPTSKKLTIDYILSSNEGIVVQKLHYDYQKCSTEPIASRVKTQLKIAKYEDLQTQLYSKFDSLSESERQQIVAQMNQQVPLEASDIETVTKFALNQNIFEIESTVDKPEPKLRETLLEMNCPEYSKGNISKSLGLSKVLTNANGDLIQKISISSSDCK